MIPTKHSRNRIDMLLLYHYALLYFLGLAAC